MSKLPTINADFLEAGSGPVVMLVHSSVSGARMWRRLMDDLKDDFHVRAVNLYGYGRTPPWSSVAPQSLDDQARLVETAPRNADTVCVVGHSFGGSVAMKLAARLSGRVTKLVLLETNPFYLLEQAGCADAFAQAMDLRNCVKKFGALGEWARAAEQFADYWGGGAASWQNMSADRRNTFVEALKPNYFEWDAVMDETTPVEQWARLLPRSTLLVSDPNTVLPIREITAILRRSCAMWTYKEIADGGHMAPLTRPDLINPLVSSFLRLQLGDDLAFPTHASGMTASGTSLTI
jgi:pimeloyl-ACP methyl ester carboxylesterase